MPRCRAQEEYDSLLQTIRPDKAHNARFSQFGRIVMNRLNADQVALLGDNAIGGDHPAFQCRTLWHGICFGLTCL